MNTNRSHPPHGGNVAAENFHKSSTEGTERRRDEPQTRGRGGEAKPHRRAQGPQQAPEQVQKAPPPPVGQSGVRADGRHASPHGSKRQLGTSNASMRDASVRDPRKHTKARACRSGGGGGDLQGGRERSTEEEIMVGGAKEERRKGRR